MQFDGAIAGHRVTVRPLTGADQPLIREIYVSHRWEEVQVLIDWTDEQKLAFLNDQFRLQCLHYEKHYHDAEFMVVEVDGQAAGRLYLWDHNPADLRIVEIGFLPDYRGRGFGTALLRAVQQRARAAGKSCSIHVEHSNPARRLYNRLDFREVELVGPYIRLHWAA
ncbi:GNAT family N-acetyltransferase [Oleisolibacter albus]|uniref:GNAT family N-acetyltransferase n=1 Tax=Oleisolibacter albus TaxID=2171757 RepID=UPI00195FA7BE|nr:N-acetyltransferase [Oleisolibacter albus]